MNAISARPSDLVKLAEVEIAAAVASVDFEDLIAWSRFREHWLLIDGLHAAVNDIPLQLRVGTAAAYQAGASYRYSTNRTNDAGNLLVTNSTGAAQFTVAENGGSNGLGTAAASRLSGAIFMQQQGTEFFKAWWRVTWWTHFGNMNQAEGGGLWQSSSAVTRVRLLLGANNMDAGRFAFYGVK